MGWVAWVVWYRELLRFARDPIRVALSTVGPTVMLFVFAHGMSPAIANLRGDIDFPTFVFPAAIAMAVVFAAMFGATSLVWDQEFGFIKEILVAPTPRAAIVLGKVAGGSTVALIQGLIVLAIGPLVGVRFSFGMLVTVVAIIVMLAVALSAFGTVLAAATKRLEAFQAVTQMAMGSMFVLSGAIFPLEGLPAWLELLVAVNPVAYGVDPLRHAIFANAGFSDEAIGDAGAGIVVFGQRLSTPAELAVLGVTGAVLMALAVRTFANKEASGGRRPARVRSTERTGPAADRAVQVIDLERRYGSVEAVKGISFDVHRSEIFGFLGPNGAGKTTTINMLCTLLAPSAGRAFVAGHDVATERGAVRQHIGVVFQEPALDDYLTARENLLFHLITHGIRRGEARRRIDDVLERLGLTEVADRKVVTFSGGMKRRLELGRGLLHSPQVLFLDEPTVGLDPQSRRQLWEYVRELQRTEQLTIFLTTHYMEEAAICDRIAIIDHGQLVALDTPDALKQRVGGDVVELRTADNERALASLADLGLRGAIHDGVIRLDHPEGERGILSVLLWLDTEIEGLDVHRSTLDDVFVSLTGRAIRDSEAHGRDVLLANQRAGTGRGRRGR